MQYGGTIYILTNRSNFVLYLGVTSDLYVRVVQHRNKVHADSYTAKYNCCKLVYYESYLRIEEAIDREKQIKKWNRAWKLNLINEFNPQWKDLFDTI